jgi:hypothetical protein
MCPVASGGMAKKYHYEDHDTDVVNETPPIQNQWYTVFDAEDVRLLWCYVLQTNDDIDDKDLEIRWTIDGTEYLCADSFENNVEQWIYRNTPPSTIGTLGLKSDGSEYNAAYYTCKRGQSFKVEIRIISVVGVNQTLLCHCVRETLEET